MFLSPAGIVEFLNEDLTLFIHLLNIYEVLLCAEETQLNMIKVLDGKQLALDSWPVSVGLPPWGPRVNQLCIKYTPPQNPEDFKKQNLNLSEPQLLLTLEQHRFELGGSTYTPIFFQ